MPAMKRIATLFALTLLSTLALADPAPPVMFEKQIIPLPGDADPKSLENLALDGDHLMLVGRTSDRRGLFAFQRGADQVWRHSQTLKQVDELLGIGVALRGNVATSDIEGFEIFDFVGGTWQARGDFGPWNGAPFAIASNEAAFATTPDCEAQLYARDSGGSWLESSLLPGAKNTQCFDPWFDADGTTAVAANRASDASAIQPRVYARDSTGSWVSGSLLPYPIGVTPESAQVSLRGERITGKVSPNQGGDLVWANFGGSWTVRGRLQAADAFESQDGDAPGSALVAGEEGLYYQLGNTIGYGPTTVVRVFRELANGQFKHFLNFETSDGGQLWGPISVSGRGVLVGGTENGELRHAYYFEVPPEMGWPPELVQENFEDGNANNWRPTSGASFALAKDSTSTVYRQSDITRSTAAAFNISNTLRNQGIEADIVPRQFAGANRWVGLMTRRMDGNNFYQASLRPPDSLYLKRVHNGVRTILQGQSTGRPIVAGQRYRLRLESIEDRHRVYLDGRLIIQVTDSQLPSGTPGLVMYQTAADFDNVIIGRGAALVLRQQSSANPEPSDAWWINTGPGQWTVSADRTAVTQSSLVSTARRITGESTDTQMVSVNVTPTVFAPSSASVDPWVGVVARYQGDSNYYYLSLRDSNQVSLRKRVGDAITGLGTRTLDVAPGQTYRLKLEVVGNRLRAYVNDALIIERVDDSFASGRYGLITYKAGARFSGFNVYQP
jgi:hypothetical protein